MANLIQYTDTLREGTDKINAAIQQSEEALQKSNTAIDKADIAKTVADNAKEMSENTQQQLNTIVIEGDSSVEAAQARVNKTGLITYGTLKERLDAERDIINVKDYGAKGDGNTDDTTAIKNAISEAMLKYTSVFFPTGTYIISDTISINNGVKLLGVDSTLSQSSVIKQTVNKPLFYVTSQCTFEGLVLRGTLNTEYTLQDGIFIDDTNGVAIRMCSFFDFYNCLHVKDTVFYSYVSDCIFYSCIHAMIFGEGTSYAGYAFQINDCQIISSCGQYGLRLQNIGSVMIDNMMCGPANLTVAGLCLESMAQGAGITNISNSGFEQMNHALELIGSADNMIRYIFFSNCYFGSNIHAVYADYAAGIHFNNCYLTGDIALFVNNHIHSFFMNSIEFQTLSAPITASTSCSNFDIDIVNPDFPGVTFFIYLPFLASTSIKRICITGGKIGSNSEPVAIPTDANANTMISVSGHGLQPYKIKRLVGTLDASGNATVEHGIYGLQYLLLNVQAVYHNGNYLAQQLNIGTVDSTHIVVGGGTANAKYRIAIIYTEQGDTNWDS